MAAPKFNHPSPPLSIPLLLSITLALSPSSATAQSPPPPLNSTSQGNLFSPTNFTPSMSIIIIVLIAGFFFLGFFSIYVRQCAGDRMEGGAGPTSQPPTMSARFPRGLDPGIIEKLPTMAYTEVKEHKVGKGALECAVCLSEFEEDEKLRLLPKCSHVFHPDCIDAWLAGHVTCPVCRDNLTVYESEEIPIPESTAGITRQEEERSEDPPAVPADAVVLEVKTETEEERREREEVIELERIRSVRRAVRSKSSRRPSRFPRSHSTGHSLSSAARIGEDPNRYTLRIPQHVLRQIIAEGKLKRSTSLREFRETGEGSSRPGYRETGGEGSSRGGGRSVRTIVRNLSEKFSSWGIGRRGGDGGDGSVKGEGSTGRGRLAKAGGATATAKAAAGEGSVGRRVDRVNADQWV